MEKKWFILNGIVALSCSSSVILLHAASTEWTWNYTVAGADLVKNNPILPTQGIFEKYNNFYFSQMLTSWNAVRPTQGDLVFYAQVRIAGETTWGNWHKMFSWGSQGQRSYGTRLDKGVRNHFVRLEVEDRRRADAFRIKVVAVGGADLRILESISVSIANFDYFARENVTQATKKLPSVHVVNVPMQSQLLMRHQRASDLCSPAACSMVAGFFTGKKHDPLASLPKVFDEGLCIYGSWSLDVAYLFEQCGGKVACSVARLESFADLHAQLSGGVPVVVSIRGDMPGALKKYDRGHFIVVTGFDAQQQKIMCHDPYWPTHKKTAQKYDIESFIRLWENSRRLAYLVKPKRGIML